MCSHDWGKKYSWKLKNKNFRYLVISKLQTARDKLNKGDRSTSPCNVCDVHGDLIGKKHHETGRN